jgi:hypothetical protein
MSGVARPNRVLRPRSSEQASAQLLRNSKLSMLLVSSLAHIQSLAWIAEGIGPAPVGFRETVIESRTPNVKHRSAFLCLTGHKSTGGGRVTSRRRVVRSRVRLAWFGASAGAAVGERGRQPKNGNERPKTETPPAGAALRLATRTGFRFPVASRWPFVPSGRSRPQHRERARPGIPPEEPRTNGGLRARNGFEILRPWIAKPAPGPKATGSECRWASER